MVWGKMDLQLSGKVALVTANSAGGIGIAISRALAGEGASVIVHGRDDQRTMESATNIGHGTKEVLK